MAPGPLTEIDGYPLAGAWIEAWAALTMSLYALLRHRPDLIADLVVRVEGHTARLNLVAQGLGVEPGRKAG